MRSVSWLINILMYNLKHSNNKLTLLQLFTQINLVFLCLAVWKVLQNKRNQHIGKKKEPVIIATYYYKAPVI